MDKLQPIRISTKGLTPVIIDDTPYTNGDVITPPGDVIEEDKPYGPEDYGPDEFEVEKILDMRVAKIDGREETYFLIKWKGLLGDSWEPKSNVYCHHLVEMFLQRKKERSSNQKKKVSPKRKIKETTPKSIKKAKPAKPTKPAKSAKLAKEETESESPTVSNNTIPTKDGKEKRANRGTRPSQLTDYHFF